MSPNAERPFTILLAEDDPDDRMLTREAFEESRLLNPLEFVEDGEELLDYLRGRGSYAEAPTHTEPGLILLDLNMPKMDGREALREIKADPDLRHIPVIVLTTSKADEDIFRSYDIGANSYITKPVLFETLVEIIRGLGHYWFELVELPDDGACTPGPKIGTDYSHGAAPNLAMRVRDSRRKKAP